MTDSGIFLLRAVVAQVWMIAMFLIEVIWKVSLVACCNSSVHFDIVYIHLWVYMDG